MEKRLELLFTNGEGKSSSLVVTDPAENLTPTQIEAAMQLIADQGIVEAKGIQRYADIRGARYVSRQVEEVFTREMA